MHAIPIAATLSVGVIVQRCRQHRENLFFEYLVAARRDMRSAVVFFSIGTTVILFIFAGWLGPYWYRHAKQELVTGFCELAQTIPAQKRVRIMPGVHVWYESSGENREWKHARFCIHKSSGNTTLIGAQRVVLAKYSFILHGGSIVKHGKRGLMQHYF